MGSTERDPNPDGRPPPGAAAEPSSRASAPGPVATVRTEVAVLGGGAAGLWAAAVAGEKGRRVVLLEKNRRVGVKILASGGGHCNLTTTLPLPGVLDAFGAVQGRFLAPSLRRLPPRAVRDVFETLGVPTREAELEKVWPVSNRAKDVADALLARALAAGVDVRTSAPVRALERTPLGFVVRCDGLDVVAERVVVTVGGASLPKSGTTGDGYAWLAAFGHTIVAPVPALAPLVIDVPWVRALAGITEPGAVVRVKAGGRVVAERRRPVLFTHTGLSGPGPMDVSRWFERAPVGGSPSLHVDLLPDLDEAALRSALDAAIAAAPAARLASVLPGGTPARLAAALAVAVGADPAGRAADVPKALRHALVRAWKDLELPVAGTRGFAVAEVTAGGVALDEVDPGTMASRLVPGLYVAGEILDVDGPIGGFNFQAAFATGEAAGRAV